MARRARSNIQFGSDSFLDVIANVVGILVILLVIAGLRVSQAPVLLSVKPVDTVPELEQVPEPELLAEPPQFEPVPELAIASEPEPEPESMLEPVLEAERDRTALLESQVAELQQDLEQKLARQRTVSGKVLRTDQQRRKIEEQLTARRQQWQELAITSETSQARVEAGVLAIEELQSLIASLQAQLQNSQPTPPKLVKLEHRLTPLSRVSEGSERHFRVARGRVAEVPIEDLVEDVRDQLGRRKDWLLKVNRYEGRVGPEKGFSLKFLVEKETGNVVDDLRYGAGMVRVSVTHWEIEPEKDTLGETVDVALKQGSQFHQVLLKAGGKAMLTFWVYPDSFDVYRKLQAYVHHLDFSVAGRPLPDGVPISGSPNGSRSAGQ